MTESTKLYQNVKVGKPKDSVIEITGEISAEMLEINRKEVLREVKSKLEIPGFRKGNAPEEMVLKHVDMNHVLEDAAEEALSTAYPAILDDFNLVPISSPRVTLVKLAQGSPVEFKIHIAVTPDVTLPNYKKIASAIKAARKPVTIDDKEAEDVITQLLTMRAGEDGKPAELTDELVKSLGKFENVADFKAKLKTNLLAEKETEATRIRYEEIARKLVDETTIALPAPLIEDEMYAAHGRLHKELEKREMKAEEYFKIIKKTEEEYVKEKKESIERQLKTKFILSAIAKKENLQADEKDIEKELQHARKHYPDSNTEAFRTYVEEMLTNEKALRFLESADW